MAKNIIFVNLKKEKLHEKIKKSAVFRQKSNEKDPDFAENGIFSTDITRNITRKRFQTDLQFCIRINCSSPLEVPQ